MIIHQYILKRPKQNTEISGKCWQSQVKKTRKIAHCERSKKTSKTNKIRQIINANTIHTSCWHVFQSINHIQNYNTTNEIIVANVSWFYKWKKWCMHSTLCLTNQMVLLFYKNRQYRFNIIFNTSISNTITNYLFECFISISTCISSCI